MRINLNQPVFMNHFDPSTLTKWLDGPGLCHGVGDGKTKVCVEQAVALSLGYDLTDTPEKYADSCIAPTMPSIKRGLNDCNWSSDKARADGLRDLAFEQLGSKGIDEKWLQQRLAELTIRELIPKLFRLVAEKQKESYKKEMLRHSYLCEKNGTAADAANAARYAANAADAAYAADEYLSLMASLILKVLREAKQKAGLPLIYELFPDFEPQSPAIG